MSKVAVVYWSGTGNTKLMADAFAEGAKAKGAEVLEEGEFEPMFTAVEGSLKDKKIALFGSYDWGDGQWMRDWEARCKEDGAKLVQPGFIANNTPNDDAIAECSAIGGMLA